MQPPNWIYKTYQLLLKTEAAIIIGLLLSMIIIATVQIIMRNFFDAGLLWAESYIRISVLWLALLGAMLASCDNKHLAIDALTHKFNTQTQHWLKRLNALFSASICFLLSYHSSLFIYSEYQDGSTAFANIPNWLCEIIIPIAFGLIACRYLLTALFNLPKN